VDVYSLCAYYAYPLYAVRDAAWHTFEGVTPDSHSWLMPFSYKDHLLSHPEEHAGERWTYRIKGRWTLRSNDVDAHLAHYGRTPESDRALWDYASFHRYLKILQQQRAGNDYLLEILPSHRWQDLQTRRPFERCEVDELLSALGEDHADTPEVFVSSLIRTEQGRVLHTKWLEFLSAAMHGERDPKYKGLPTWRDRRVLSSDLLQACSTLQGIFPDETLPHAGARFETTLLLVLINGLRECGAPFVASRTPEMVTLTEDGEALLHDVRALEPSRYSESGEGSAVWFDDPRRGPVPPQKGGALWSDEDRLPPSQGYWNDPRIRIGHRIPPLD